MNRRISHESDLMRQMAVRSTLEAYFSSVDRRDWLTYGKCFTENAQFKLGHHEEPEIIIGRKAIVERAEQRIDRPTSNHLLSNTHISISGARAKAITHGIAHLVVLRDEKPVIVVRGIRYEDELIESSDGPWQISRRVHTPLWQYKSPSMQLGY